jgi:RNA polymerase sigma-70 factor, ECF subfamily
MEPPPRVRAGEGAPMALARGQIEDATTIWRRIGGMKAIWRYRRGRDWLQRPSPLAVEQHDEPPPLGPHAAGVGRSADAEFEAFFRLHERAIFTYLWRMTSEEQAAYDLSQEVFVRAWRHFERIRGYELPAGWLFRVATNLALNHRRSRATSSASLEAVDAEERFARSDPARHLGEEETVRRALMELPARQRAALVLRAVHGMGCAEIAEALGVSRDAAKMLIFRAREAFRRQYEREGDQQ